VIWLIIGAVEGMIILWLVIEILTAPNGYEDENGFHEIKEGQHYELHRKSCSSRNKIRRTPA